MGCCQAIQPAFSKVSIPPPLVIQTPATTLSALSFSEDASQPHPDPGVQGLERRLIAVLEISKPATQRGIQRPDDCRKAFPGVPFRFRSNRVLEFLQALGTWKALAFHELISQKLKGVFVRVDDPRLGWMQGQSGCRRPFL